VKEQYQRAYDYAGSVKPTEKKRKKKGMVNSLANLLECEIGTTAKRMFQRLGKRGKPSSLREWKKRHIKMTEEGSS